MRKFFRTCLRVIMEESVRAEQFLYVKHALQYVHGHAGRSKRDNLGIIFHITPVKHVVTSH